ncbi:helix-turn-helix domain-containing protein [Crocosphaera sp. Alani8]|uniref:helix-turn-helix domain-containing protein n=1 Tax=Crocosphaera sp. Alani8 TaxID=3038952 RepID=UPI00313E9F30
MSNKKEIIVTKGSDNVFEDLGFDAPEAANLAIRAELMLDLRHFIEEQGWTQGQAAEFFGETQPRIGNLINGNINRFSLDKLVVMLGQAGKQVTVEVTEKAA